MFNLTIETDNAAFGDDRAAELARILRLVASRLESTGEVIERNLFDSNGNKVGRVTEAQVPGDPGRWRSPRALG